MLLSTLTVLLICTAAGSGKTLTCEDKKCSHDCILEKGLATCSCPDYMTLGPDSKSCEVPVSILMGTFRAVVRVTEHHELTSVLPIQAKTFDYHYARKELFTYANNTILRYSLTDKSSHPESVATVDTMVTSLAVDWVHNDIYWICRQQSVVEAARVEGGGHRVIASTENSDNPPHWHNIVIDPYVKTLFWLGNEGVYHSGLAGGEVESTMASWMLQLEGIALDTSKQHVYVIGSDGDGDNKVVGRTLYDGSQAIKIFTVAQPDSKIYGFGVIGKVLYWQSSYEGENLYRCKIPAAGEKANVSMVEELNQIVFDMKIYHPDLQKPMK